VTVRGSPRAAMSKRSVLVFPGVSMPTNPEGGDGLSLEDGAPPKQSAPLHAQMPRPETAIACDVAEPSSV
jgi:hypothetical protein